MAAETFDRKAEDVGNIVFLEHVNFRVPDQQLATAFYVTALGFTRDPYLMVGLDNMWINLGRSQFHLPTGNPNHSRGRVGCVVSDFDALPERLHAAEKWLSGTKYTHRVEKNHADVTCPWGNRMRLHRTGADFGFMTLGMPYVEFPVPTGHADGIARFYREIFYTPACVKENGEGRAAHDEKGPETGPPAVQLIECATQHRGQHGSDGRGHGHVADGACSLVACGEIANDGDRNSVNGGDHRLHHAEAEKHPDVGRQQAAQRCDEEKQQSGQDHGPPAETIRQRSHHELQCYAHRRISGNAQIDERIVRLKLMGDVCQ